MSEKHFITPDDVCVSRDFQQQWDIIATCSCTTMQIEIIITTQCCAKMWAKVLTGMHCIAKMASDQIISTMTKEATIAFSMTVTFFLRLSHC
jgi:hypothetical protein